MTDTINATTTTNSTDLEMVIANPWAIRFVQDETDELRAAAFAAEPWTLGSMKLQRPGMCKAAVLQNPAAKQYVWDLNMLL